MIEVIKSPTPVVEKKQWTAFLAGPMNGAPSWQAQAPKVAAKVGIENLTLLNPHVIPDGTVTICSCAFGVCEHFVHVSAPSNLRVIGDGIFGRGGGRIVIRTPKG